MRRWWIQQLRGEKTKKLFICLLLKDDTLQNVEWCITQVNSQTSVSSFCCRVSGLVVCFGSRWSEDACSVGGRLSHDLRGRVRTQREEFLAVVPFLPVPHCLVVPSVEASFVALLAAPVCDSYQAIYTLCRITGKICYRQLLISPISSY